MLRLANLSNIELTLGRRASAAALSVVARNTRTALRVAQGRSKKRLGCRSRLQVRPLFP